MCFPIKFNNISKGIAVFIDNNLRLTALKIYIH